MSQPSVPSSNPAAAAATRRTSYTVPDKPALEGLEERWSADWNEKNVYGFDRTAPREAIFSIDTPPPTVSGSLHVGHVFSYTHTDVVARFQRMKGKAVFYPMGWDDNGLPTERRVENFYGVVCDADVPYAEGYEPPAKVAERRSDFARISRRNFIELCHRLTSVDEVAFRELWVRLGISVDWALTYATIDERSQRVSQRAFVRNFARGEVYSQQAPCLWDVTFQTAIAQAELEDRDAPGAYHDIRFSGVDGPDLLVSTTRPELLPSCVALVAHPDDERYKGRFGSLLRSPVFGVEIPLVAHALADPTKGTGAAMICTFGDNTDVIWWRELNLPTRSLIGKDGRFQSERPEWLTSDQAAAAYAQVAGYGVSQARKAVVGLLAASGELVGQPRPIVHSVKYFEKGDRPLEIVATRQWYVRNGGRSADLRGDLLKRGKELSWHPAYMQTRYENWVGGLNGDWLISRQRVFGVSIPVWYPLDSHGEPRYDAPIVAREDQLPVDPRSHVPPGYAESQRGQSGGFIGDPDVMDTWATSSLTPQIAGGWEDDPGLFAKVFPMDVRPQAHDIIRTWLFSTVVRSHFEHGLVPWKNATLSGWILDPDRKKMSKSKGNVVTPTALLQQYGSDGVRYWAAKARPGTDTAFEEQQMKIGRRLAMKLLNISKYVLAVGGDGPGPVSESLDRAMLRRLAVVVAEATASLEGFDYSRALEVTEAFFWWYCDDYVELSKVRAYGAGSESASARNALGISLSVLQRLFAPYMPFATAECWSWWMEGSIHIAAWPDAGALREHAGPEADERVLDAVCDVLREIRKAKAEAKVSMKADVASLVVEDSAERLALLSTACSDLSAAGQVKQLQTRIADAFRAIVQLA
ncbi:MAG: valine--tRNA ligase [Aquincola sp.]|nr:valine--tRNA ligase [Aquincola sp.]